MLYADMLGPILIEAPGCPEMVCERVLHDAVLDFYREVALWVHHDEAAQIETTGALTLTLPDDSEVVTVRQLRTDIGAIEPRTVDEFMYREHTEGDPAIVVEINGAWLVRPAPSEVTAAVATVQLAPVYGCDGVVDAVAHRHRRLYEHLALARLLVMPRQPWTDVQRAGYHAGQATRLRFELQRRTDGWSTLRTPVVRYGGI